MATCRQYREGGREGGRETIERVHELMEVVRARVLKRVDTLGLPCTRADHTREAHALSTRAKHTH